MTMIFFLKMLCDAAIYYTLAVPFALFLGGGNLLPGMLLQCVIYALARIPSKKWLRLLLLAPLAVCYYLCSASLADMAVLTPATCYIFWHTLRNTPAPQLERQREILEQFGKLLSLLVVAVILFRWINGTLPMLPDTHKEEMDALPGVISIFAVLFLAGSVALLRTLRHNPEVYLQRRFQLINFSTLAVVPAVALLLGSKSALSAYDTVFGALYHYFLSPIVILIATLPVLLVNVLIQLLKPLIPNPGLEESEAVIDTGEFLENELSGFLPADIGPVWRTIGIVVLLLGAAIALFLLFRRLSRSYAATAAQTVASEARSSLSPNKPADKPARNSSPVYAIRWQYRRFLKLCTKKGLCRKESSTSQDIDAMVKKLPGIGAHSPNIRSIYIRARYWGKVSLEDVRQMNSLLSKVRKNSKT